MNENERREKPRSLYVDEHVHRALRVEVAKRGISLRTATEEAVREWITKRTGKQDAAA